MLVLVLVLVVEGVVVGLVVDRVDVGLVDLVEVGETLGKSISNCEHFLQNHRVNYLRANLSSMTKS